MKYLDVLVGFSGNVEVPLVYDPSDPAIKGGANSIGLEIGGTSCNIASALHALGRSVKALITVGTDETDPWREMIERGLAQSGFAHRLMLVREETSRAVILLPHGKRSHIAGFKGSYLRYPQDEVERDLLNTQPRIRAVTGAQGVEVPLIKAMFEAPVKDSLTVLNPRQCLIEHHDLLHVLRRTDFLSLNADEMRQLIRRMGDSCPDGEVHQSHLQLVHQYGPLLVLVTFGKEGAWLSHAEGSFLRQGTVECGEANDPTGAGDCMLAGFLASYLDQSDQGKIDYAKCLLWGATLSGLHVCQIGGSPRISRSAVEERIRLYRGTK